MALHCCFFTRLSLLLILSFAAALNIPIPSLYAPRKTSCPSTSFVRPATSLSPSESAYISARAPKAAAALASWVNKAGSGFDTSKVPTVALVSSGGGYRALLTGAGIIQGLDARDSTAGTAGLYQGLTWHSALSGGGWLLGSIIGSNWPTVSSLRDGRWAKAFAAGLFDPNGNPLNYGPITVDILAKQGAGYKPTLVDAYGRALSYQLLPGFDGGAAVTLSGVTGNSNFKSNDVAYPIFVADGVNTFDGQCIPNATGTQYELHPYEFGSWDAGVRAFTPTQYLGTSVTNGAPATPCTVNYDNLGYVMGTSSNVLNEVSLPILPVCYHCAYLPDQVQVTPLPLCAPIPTIANNTIEGFLASIINTAHALTTRDLYAPYLNPFRGSAASTLVSAQTELDLADGGESGQNDPIWPLIQNQRAPDVLVVSDASSDTELYPNGTALYHSYQPSLAEGLSRMPVIPPPEVFLSQKLYPGPRMFGCRDKSKATIVWLPNQRYTFQSNTSTFKLQYSVDETNGTKLRPCCELMSF